MTDAPQSQLRTCPDCGSILDATEPAWATALEPAATAPSSQPESTRWQCLICGYHEESEPSASMS